MKTSKFVFACLMVSAVQGCASRNSSEDPKSVAVGERDSRDSLSSSSTSTKYSPAEYARQEGLLLNIPSERNLYPFFGTILRTAIETGVTPSILVNSLGWSESVYDSVLAPKGIRKDQVRFIVVDNSEFWARDYGPWFTYENNKRVIVDQLYGYGWRDRDDKVPIKLGKLWQEPVYTTSLNTEGGNFMTDGRGTCWMSTGVLEPDANDLPEADVAAMLKADLGCLTVTFVPPLPNEGTTHIDMFSKVLNQDTIMVGYTTAELGGYGDEIAHLDEVAELYRNSPKPGGGKWTIVRVPTTFGSGIMQQRTPNAHTNSLLFNGRALVPTYGEGTDDEALAVYRKALPEYTVVPVESSKPIWYGGAVHCTTMQIPSKQYSACGDGVVQSEERCEANYLKGASCQSLGFAGGTLGCSASCGFDTSKCTGSSN
jgi:agmatine deiminase